MRKFLIVLTGALVGTAVMVTVGLAAPRIASKPSVPSAGSGMAMSGGMGTMMSAASAATVKLTIQHVQRGCHVWSNGKTTAAMMRFHLTKGQHLSIVDMDIDAHQMLQFAGPAHLRMGGPMMMNHSITLSFPKAGVYRLGTKTVEMPGGMDVKTIGPDNNLRLVVTVE